jgi:hypothetical protein
VKFGEPGEGNEVALPVVGNIVVVYEALDLCETIQLVEKLLIE